MYLIACIAARAVELFIKSIPYIIALLLVGFIWENLTYIITIILIILIIFLVVIILLYLSLFKNTHSHLLNNSSNKKDYKNHYNT